MNQTAMHDGTLTIFITILDEKKTEMSVSAAQFKHTYSTVIIQSAFPELF